MCKTRAVRYLNTLGDYFDNLFEKLKAKKGLEISPIILDGNALIESEKARAQGVTTSVKTVATVNPTTRDAAICSQKLVM